MSGTGTVDLGIGSTNAGGAYLYLDGDSNGDFSGSDYSYIGHDTSGQLLIHQDSPSGSDNILLRTNGSTRWTLNSSGNLFPAATSQGIVLGATSDTAANRLDDYEEGTYTGVITDGGSGGTVTLNGDNTFHYTKIGRMVFVMGNANRNDSTGYTNNLQLSIPFTSSSTQNMNAPNGGVWLDGTGTDKVALVYVSNGQNYVLFKESGDSSDYVTTDNFQNSRPLYASFFYFTDA